jgi:hypothetical protein
MTKNSRSQSVVSRQSDSEYSDNHWLRQFEDKLQKTSVQPRGQSLYDQISSIMNTKSKYPSVQAAVDDMMQRSGLTDYLDNVKTSEETLDERSRKTAQDQNDKRDHNAKKREEHSHSKIPEVLQSKPSIMRTLENVVRESRGNLPVPAIITRLRSLHAHDIADDSAWEDDRLIRLVSDCCAQAKRDNPATFDQFDQLGKGDGSMADHDVDPSNTDAFNSLMPAKI